jgi:RHH-type proline utilization regulon transcriptional repressor/proline dehydrogenase/delta 1-pyrroline-5-carboxylate dehydrogenase
LIELDSLQALQGEVFGPVLHVLRYRRHDLGALIGQINQAGYGLTLGLHTRIDETIAQVVQLAGVGNVYINRNMVGAVVGVQPFGGEGLSGTGPKAGGPLYLLRLLAQHPDDALVQALPGVSDGPLPPRPALAALGAWAVRHGLATLAAQCRRFGRLARSGCSYTLPGPTGERNSYTLMPRAAVLCLAYDEADRLVQLAAVLSVGSAAVWPMGPDTERLHSTLPREVRTAVVVVQDWTAAAIQFDFVLHHGKVDALLAVCRTLADRPGPIIGIRGFVPGELDIPMESLVTERSLSINTAAAGGNASLMAIG